MFRIFSFAVLAGAVCLLATPLWADDAKKPDESSPEARHAALFEKLDANHDGFITTEEVPAEHRHLFDRLLHRADKNSDGKLSREEFMAGMVETPAADRPAGPPPERQADDKSKDSPASPQRARGLGPQGGRPGERMMMGVVIFHALDTNGDGKLDEKEIAAAADSLKKLAKNGEITHDDLMQTARETMGGAFGAEGPGGGRPEFNPEEVAKRMMQRFDKNSDGKLQKDELPPRMQEHFDQLDTNHDGVLDEAELKAAAPQLIRRLAEERSGGQADRAGKHAGQSDEKKPE